MSDKPLEQMTPEELIEWSNQTSAYIDEFINGFLTLVVEPFLASVTEAIEECARSQGMTVNEFAEALKQEVCDE